MHGLCVGVPVRVCCRLYFPGWIVAALDDLIGSSLSSISRDGGHAAGAGGRGPGSVGHRSTTHGSPPTLGGCDAMPYPHGAARIVARRSASVSVCMHGYVGICVVRSLASVWALWQF